MAAVQEGVNFVRIFFYAKNTISAKRKKALVGLAYQTARDQLLAPKEILIRSDLHGTTNIKGDVSKIPRVGMAPLLSKARTSSCANTTLRHTEKADDTPRGRPKEEKVVWPPMDQLEEYEDSPIGYSHLPGQN
ncbi:hypothetical protein CA14_006295 [Aspergillus flavus]|uniref:Uncharacterized protein n=1 Tax=Aspergillus flavus TaxID=5059 RepID=A0AB74BUR9_ASPFL|nr:hypothetical protein CA14_006295 [Aspergillus flavus]